MEGEEIGSKSSLEETPESSASLTNKSEINIV